MWGKVKPLISMPLMEKLIIVNLALAGTHNSGGGGNFLYGAIVDNQDSIERQLGYN